jgi:hypothetical protein
MDILLDVRNKSEARKTVEVVEIKKLVNHMLEHSTCSPAERQAMAGVLERVLMFSGNYKGFNYLCPPSVMAERPGVTYPLGYHPEAPDFDESRRFYF